MHPTSTTSAPALIDVQQPIARNLDPRAIGCRCDECPLGKLHRENGSFRPVLPEIHGGEDIVAISEQPSAKDVQYGYPFAGQTGEEFEVWLETVKLSRRRVVLTHSILCQPPDGNYDLMMSRAEAAKKAAERTNIARRKSGMALLPVPVTPLEACRPHVLRLVFSRPYVLLMGARAYQSVTGQRTALRRVRGAFMSLTAIATEKGVQVIPEEKVSEGVQKLGVVRAVPTFSPAFVRKKLVARELTLRDFDRLLRWRDNRLDWPSAEQVAARRNPTYAELYNFLYGPNAPRHFGIDVETEGKESLTARLRTLCITSSDMGYVIHFRSTDGQVGLGDGWSPKLPSWVRRSGLEVPPRGFYPPAEAAKIRALVKRFLEDPKKQKIGHNWNYFDEEVVQREVPATTWGWISTKDFAFDAPGILPGIVWDTIVGSRGDNSELPRDLYTLGTRTTDVPAWKEDNEGKKLAFARSDRDLADYNNIDGIVTDRAGVRLLASVRRRGVEHVINLDFRLQHIMREMHHLGMCVDEAKRRTFEERLTEERHKYRQQIRDFVGDSNFNPQSEKQLSSLFFGQLKFPPIKNSEKTGKPSLDDDVLRAYRRMVQGHTEVVDLIDAHRRFRKVSKELSTYILPMRRWDDLRKNSKGEMVGGYTYADGRIRPHYSVHIPATGRRSSSGPNWHNIPKHLRALVIPGPGNAFTGADYDQIELRLVSGIAGVEAYLIVFREGGDPHATTALLIYGPVFEAALKESLTPEQWIKYKQTGSPEKAEHGSDIYESLRRFAKTFVYAVIYGGTARTIFESVSSAEDPKTGELLFPTMTYEMVKVAYDAWMRNAKEVPAWWKRMEADCRRDKYVREPIMGRIRDFPEYNPTEVPNHPIQGGAGVIMARGICRLRDVIPPDFIHSRGIVSEVHDAVTVEHEDTDFAARLAAEMIEESLTQSFVQVPGVVFTASAKGPVYNWKDT